MWAVAPIPASIAGIAITVESVDDTIAQAVVEHAYPGRDGADLEDMGAEPFRAQIVGHVRGPTWLEDLEVIEAAIRFGGPIDFVHPQWGTKSGKIRSFAIGHRDTEHSIARIRFDFVEGNTVLGAFATGLTPLSAAAAVRAAAATVTAASVGLS